MDGLMMDRPLLVKQIAERAEAVFADREVVARTQDGVERSTYGQVVERARRLAGALAELGVEAGRPRRELRLELAAPPGALPRGPEHGRGPPHAQHPPVRGGPALHRRPRGGPRDLPRRLAGGGDAALRGRRARGPDARRRRASARGRSTTRSSSPAATRASSFPTSTRTPPRPCATRAAPRAGRRASCTRTARSSSTRSARRLPDSMGIREADSVMPVVPMFHAMAWGIPYIAAMAGARQVLPGPRPQPASAGRPDRRRAASPGAPACRRSGTACSSSIRRPTSPACGS